MGKLKFTVIAPAQMQGANGVVTPDPIPMYLGDSLPNGGFNPNFSGAIITGGSKVGNKWMGCNYTKAPWVIPGLGTIEEM